MLVENSGSLLRLSDERGFRHDFHAFWLRESSANAEYRDPQTGHKIQDAETIPLQVSVVGMTRDADRLDLQFSDGHRATYSIVQLTRAAETPGTQELIGAKVPWDGSLDPLPWYQQEELASDPRVLLALLNDIARLGFALVRGIPAEHNGSERFIELLGPFRMTNNGGIEDIKAMGSGIYDLSMTPRALEPHCDNPYRVPQPGYTLLHCISNDAQGGDSALIDGLHVAGKIRNERPDLFEALTSVRVVFRYVDDQAILEHTCPFIDVNADGSIGHVRFHGRCDQVIAADPDVLSTFYEARRLYSSLIMSETTQVQFKLQPGELFMVDNYRLFHARKAFRLDTGTRHMQQAYIDRDVVSSRQKTLLRNINSKPWKPRI